MEDNGVDRQGLDPFPGKVRFPGPANFVGPISQWWPDENTIVYLQQHAKQFPVGIKKITG